MLAQIDRRYAIYGVGRLLRRLASYAFFEGRPITTRGRWFNPVVFGLLRTLAAVPGRPAVDRPIFITGLGRSGTTILGILMSLHRDVGFLNEPKALWHVIDPRQDINGNYSASGGIFRMGRGEITPGTSLKARRIFARYLSAVGGRRVVDKYPELIFRTEYLLELFPDARIIFITRNGPDACDSIVKWSRRLGTSSSGHVDDWWGRDDLKWHYLREQIINQDELYAPVRAIAALDPDHLHRAALEWITTMREGLRCETLYPRSVLRIRYEDLVSSSRRELTRLMDLCGLPVDEAVLDYAVRRLYRNRRKTWPALQPPVEELFVETSKMLGYETGGVSGNQQ